MLGKRVMYNDLHVFDTTANDGEGCWTELPNSGMSPSPRRGHSANIVKGRRAAAEAVKMAAEQAEQARDTSGKPPLARSDSNASSMKGSMRWGGVRHYNII